MRQKYILIDTAGVRQERRIDDSVEFFSVKRTEDSIARSDIVIFVMDAEAGMTSQDKKVAGQNRRGAQGLHPRCQQMGPGGAGAGNGAREELRQEEEKRREGQDKPLTTPGGIRRNGCRSNCFFWITPRSFSPRPNPVSIWTACSNPSAMSPRNCGKRCPPPSSTAPCSDAIERRQPVSSAGHRLKFFYATQVKQSPPTFLLFVNREDLFSDQYKKYLAGEMRKRFRLRRLPHRADWAGARQDH